MDSRIHTSVTRVAFLLTMFLLSMLFGGAYAILAERNPAGTTILTTFVR